MAKLVFSPELVTGVKALASESRIQILLLFVDGQARTVNEIADAVALGQSTVSEHLALMKHAGLLLAERQGKEVYYRPDTVYLTKFLDRLSSTLKKCCK
ncbi:MAG: winged helix-turn-helix transcriptional regulator [Chloroflexi bacterium]|nr:winged helix-turn-helix transcriptional regulator [Chloroflexota bacterium]